MPLFECFISSYPAVVGLSITDRGTAEPATIVADCLAVDTGANLPSRSFLRVSRSRPAGTGYWDLFSIGGGRRISGREGVIRYVFADDRHVFSAVRMPRSFNQYDSEGQLDPSSSRTINQLWAEIASATGANITVVSTPPAFNPPAPWAGKTATQCANSLLELTGSRMLYNPTTTSLVVDWAGNGTALNLDGRMRRQLPSVVWNNLEVYSSPILFDGPVSCNAVWVNDDGDLESMASLEGDEAIRHAFVGFPEVDDKRRRNRLVQSAFRIWKPATVSHPETLGHPADLELASHRGVPLTAANDTTFEAIKVQQTDVGINSQHNLSGSPRGRGIQYDRDSGLLLSDYPIIACNNDGVLQTGVRFIAGYQIREASHPGGLRAMRQQRMLNAGPAVTKKAVVPMVRPIDSVEDDGPTAGSWEALLSSIANAIEPWIGGQGEEVFMPNWIIPANWGRTSSIQWTLRMDHGQTQTTRFTVNSAPAGVLQTIGAMS